MNDYKEWLIKRLGSLNNCKKDCDNCILQYQEEGDEMPWCGVHRVLIDAINYIKEN